MTLLTCPTCGHKFQVNLGRNGELPYGWELVVTHHSETYHSVRVVGLKMDVVDAPKVERSKRRAAG